MTHEIWTQAVDDAAWWDGTPQYDPFFEAEIHAGERLAGPPAC